MIGTSIIILLAGIFSVIYSIPYANFEFKQKNKAGAIMIYIIALALIIALIVNSFI